MMMRRALRMLIGYFLFVSAGLLILVAGASTLRMAGTRMPSVVLWTAGAGTVAMIAMSALLTRSRAKIAARSEEESSLIQRHRDEAMTSLPAGPMLPIRQAPAEPETTPVAPPAPAVPRERYVSLR